MSKKTIYTILVIALVVILSDQSTKYLAKKYLYEAGERQIPVLGDILKFTYIENAGVAFGIEIFGGRVGVMILTIVAIIGISYYFYIIRKENMPYRICFGLILGGAFGNLVDRIVNGRVIDFIHLDIYKGMVWDIYVAALPIFNIADMSITTSIIIIFLWQKKIFEDPKPQDEGVEIPVDQHGSKIKEGG